MAQEWAKAFYNSKQWIKCRQSFLISKLYVCERCGTFGDKVHHKTYLNSINISNPEITLNWDNLECLCHECHNLEHNPRKQKAVIEGLHFDKEGNLIKVHIPPVNNVGVG